MPCPSVCLPLNALLLSSFAAKHYTLLEQAFDYVGEGVWGFYFVFVVGKLHHTYFATEANPCVPVENPSVVVVV